MSAIAQPIHTNAGGSTRRFRRVLPALLWMVFASGIAIEAFVPQLTVKNHSFVMQLARGAQGADLDPAVAVTRERRVQWAAGLLTLGGAMALAFWYRRSLAEALQREKNSNPQSR